MTETRLYLDIDGVLHRQLTHNTAPHLRECRDGGLIAWPSHMFEFVSPLAELLQDFPEAQIYIHSSWRYMWRESRPEDMVDFLGPLAERYVRNVPYNSYGTRLEVILRDLEGDAFDGHWVAVDDHDDGFTRCGYGRHFVHTERTRGLGDSSKLNELRQKLTVRDAGSMTPTDIAKHLKLLQEVHLQTNEEVITQAESGILTQDADHHLWLILLGRGDLIIPKR